MRITDSLANLTIRRRLLAAAPLLPFAVPVCTGSVGGKLTPLPREKGYDPVGIVASISQQHG
jgi:hypothetical protein